MTNNTYAVPNGLKAIDKNIGTITTNATKLNALIHATAMGIMTHAAPVEFGGRGTGDTTRALAIVKAMPASMRRTMLIQWFSDFSPITVKLADDKVGVNKGKTANPWNLEAANETPFYELAEQNPEETIYDLEKLLKMVEVLGKRIEKKISDGKVAGDDVEYANRVVVQLAGVHVVRSAKRLAAGNAKLAPVADTQAAAA